MYHNLQQAQQLINTIDQMASQIRQQEASNQQLLSQIEQREGQVTQRLHQIQQMCQECSRVLQNVTSTTNQSFRTMPMQGSFQQEMAAPMGLSNIGYQTSGISLGQPQNVGTFLPTQAPLIDPTTMGASTYYDSMRQFGGQGNQNLYTPGGVSGLQTGWSGISGFGAQSGTGFAGQGTTGWGGSFQNAGVNLGQHQNVGGILQTQSPLVDPTTMGASTYNNSLRQFGGQGNQNLYTPGGVSGLQAGSSFGSLGQGGIFGPQAATNFSGQGGTSGINMEISSLPTQTPFASTATMGPDKYQSAAQKLGGTSMSLSTVGQQAGITNL